MTFRLKDPRKRNPKVQKILDAGDGKAADAGRWLADLVRAAAKDVEEDASLGFTRGARLDDKDGLFEPSTSPTYRAVKVAAPGAVPKAQLVRLLKQAAAIARAETEVSA